MPSRNPSWKNSIIKVLEQGKANAAMDYKDIADKIVSRKIKTKVGATPSSSVNSAIRNSIRDDGEKSPFEWVGTGLYRLRPESETTESISARAIPSLPPEEVIEENNSKSIIHAFGMFWQREKVNWKNNPKLFGIQQTGTTQVDFSAQNGIYLLHDNTEVVYVGRSIDRPLGTRLFEHTRDRLNGRWDRFSWFGLKNVTEEGKLEENPLSPSVDTIITTMEALLIEGLEPRQNRRRGDDLKDYEYLQSDDPAIKRQIKKDIMAEMMKNIE